MYNQMNNDGKELSQLFKEIQDIRYGRAKPVEIEEPKPEIKFNRIYVVDKKFNVIGAIIGILFVMLFFTFVNSSTIFATSGEEKIAISKYEENDKALEIMTILSDNISDSTKKEVLTNELKIDYETKYIENDQLPTGEENVIQKGKVGYKNQTVIRTYENNELVDEKMVSEVVKTEPEDKIIEKGTSDFLANLQVKIGDTIYTTDNVKLYTDDREDEDQMIGYIYQYIDITLLAVSQDWCYISADGTEGYIKNDNLTSEAITPEIKEASRKKRILITVNEDMELNEPSGLTKEDFKNVLSGHSEDKNKIIEDNAEVFYNTEQEYGINGIFLASIAIHESNWGTSKIAKTKKNLFGYGAYDASPYSSSYEFESYEYGINLVGKILSKYYLNEKNAEMRNGDLAIGTYYNGATVKGVNTRYASDTNWANRVYSIMVSLYEKL